MSAEKMFNLFVQLIHLLYLNIDHIANKGPGYVVFVAVIGILWVSFFCCYTANEIHVITRMSPMMRRYLKEMGYHFTLSNERSQ